MHSHKLSPNISTAHSTKNKTNDIPQPKEELLYMTIIIISRIQTIKLYQIITITITILNHINKLYRKERKRAYLSLAHLIGKDSLHNFYLQ